MSQHALYRLAAERSRAALRARLQDAQRQETLGHVAAGLAHDFNNLLAAVTGSANLISEDKNVSKSNREAAERITTAGFRAGELVNKLLDLGSGNETKEEVDLKELLQEALEFSDPSIRSGTRVTTALGCDPAKCYTSRTDFLQLSLNLIINALDSLPAHGGEVSVELKLNSVLPQNGALLLGRIDPAYNYARIKFTDSGVGIPASQINDIFSAYFTTKGVEGTGLGLAVVASVVKANDGGILLRTKEGEGTTFEVYWPLHPTVMHVENVDLTVDPTNDLNGITILVVDDELTVAQIIAQQLELCGAEVSALDDPFLALEVISEDPDAWGCLITDYHMPGMNGGELVEEIMQLSPDLPKIVMTGLVRRLRDPRINSKSVNSVLAKPIERKKLLRAVRKAIDSKNPITT